MLTIDFEQFIRDRIWFGWMWNENPIYIYPEGYSRWEFEPKHRWKIAKKRERNGYFIAENGFMIWYE